MRPPVPRLAALAAALALLSPPTRAADPKPLTVDEVWSVQRVGTPVLSPDGRSVAFTVATYDMEENRSNADIWVVPTAGGAPRHLTAGKTSETSPAWSPDGRRLAFVSKRDGDLAAQLYVLPLDGGEAERITEMPLGVSDPKWLPDGRRIAFVAEVVAGAETPEGTRKALDAREKGKMKARVTESRLYRFWDRWLTDDQYPHLFLVEVETRKLTDLLPGSKRYFGLQDGAGDYDVSPDGKTIVFAANRTEPPYRTLDADLFAVSTEGGSPRDLTPDNPASDSGPRFSPDGKRIAYGLERKADGWPDYTRLGVLDVSTGRTTVLTEGWDNSAAGWTWTRNGQTLVFHAEVRGRTNVYKIAATGGEPALVHKGGTTTGAEVTPEGKVVFSRQSFDRPPELAVVGLDGNGLRALTTVNDTRAGAWRLGAVQDLTFKGAGGEDVQMYVVFPPDYVPGKRYPLVQLVHGGPHNAFGDAFHFRWNAQAFAAPGYLVALVNFHGSSSFGQPFLESILGAHGDKPFTDVMKATDFLIEKGLVDESRMAAAGGSYGGYLVNWIAGHTDRFKALVSHAGVYSLLGQSGSDSTYGRHLSYGGYPFTDLASVERWSPDRFAGGFKTPMLILHGERDFRVPAAQGLEIYGVLTAKGVPARLVYYPDENHWVLKGQNSKHWYGEVLGWLARWLN